MRDCLLVDHRPHCRFEVTNEPALPLIEALIAEGACGLVSLMDHTPGQGQFPTSESYRRYYQKRYGHDEKYVDVALAEKMEGARRSIERIHRLAERTRAAGLPLASHDDDHADRVELMREVGATISEFPLNLAAAATARARGLRTVFGALMFFAAAARVMASGRSTPSPPAMPTPWPATTCRPAWCRQLFALPPTAAFPFTRL